MSHGRETTTSMGVPRGSRISCCASIFDLYERLSSVLQGLVCLTFAEQWPPRNPSSTPTLRCKDCAPSIITTAERPQRLAFLSVSLRQMQNSIVFLFIILRGDNPPWYWLKTSRAVTHVDRYYTWTVVSSIYSLSSAKNDWHWCCADELRGFLSSENTF